MGGPPDRVGASVGVEDLLLPATDRAVLVQAIAAVAVFSAALVMVWRDDAWRLLVMGLATLTAAWFGLRMLH